ncbi:hypothetical protein [Planctomicrobium sp. SH664]|uniref:hypothetical protein n=1 Tax=Planctomicrobium sp. SH664 TaxID=3448125 RepID=UPI003F5BDC12
MFYRQQTDGTRLAIELGNLFAGPTATPCWIIGGGPSLATLPIAEMVATPGPKFALNLAGSGLLRPQFWTSYDPTSRFQRSIYLDPAIIKFVHGCRAMDLIPDTTYKVCEAPGLFFFERRKEQGFHDFLTSADGITDWQDSLIQAIVIAWQLGFRTLYLAGCELRVAPSTSLLTLAAKSDIRPQPGELLGDLVKRCERAGISRSSLESAGTSPQYHFDEVKPLAAAIQTDFHYFRVVQYLRLCRRAMALAGLSLISATPGSRLNDFFPYVDAQQACEQIRQALGNPGKEMTRGKYTGGDKTTGGEPSPHHRLVAMRDFRPHHWPAPASRPSQAATAKEPAPAAPLQRVIDGIRETPVDLTERG